MITVVIIICIIVFLMAVLYALKKVYNLYKVIYKINHIISYDISREINHAVYEITNEITNRTHHVTQSGLPNSVFEQLINDPEYYNKINIFKSLLDDDSKIHVDHYIRKAKILPKIEGMDFMNNLYFNSAMGLFSTEDYFMVTNKAQILAPIKEKYGSKYNIADIPIHLHAHYYRCGMLYIPNRVLKQLEGTVALDCGAWLGDTAIMLNECGFEEVHCFEPHPKTVEILKNNLDANKHTGNFYIHNKAVGSSCSKLKFKDGGYRGGASTISDNGDIEVDVVALDTFLDLSKRVGLIKLDVEGYEEPALRGAEKLLRQYMPILLIGVYHEKEAPGEMFSVQKFINELNLGYKFIFRGMQPDFGLIYEYDLICYVDTV